MGTITLKDNYKLSNYGVPYVVAEMNTSHFGKIDTAKKMVDAALEAGCNCVKFQSWNSESLYSNTYYKANPIAKRIVDKFSFSEEKLFELSQYCKKVGIGFASTPYSNEEVKFLVEKCEVPFVKIASMEINNHPFLRYIGETGIPIILSTGMADEEEIVSAVKVLESTGNKNLCILHCVSIYPPNVATLNLNNILLLRKLFPDYAIGYSDHSLGIEIPSAAVALGACLIEKHFTLDNKLIGMDNQMAIEPQQMKQMVSDCKNVNLALGSMARVVSVEELNQRKNMRRSIVTAHSLSAGQTIGPDDLIAKRPGTGIPPSQIQQVLGKKILREYPADEVLSPEDLHL